MNSPVSTIFTISKRVVVLVFPIPDVKDTTAFLTLIEKDVDNKSTVISPDSAFKDLFITSNSCS